MAKFLIVFNTNNILSQIKLDNMYDLDYIYYNDNKKDKTKYDGFLYINHHMFNDEVLTYINEHYHEIFNQNIYIHGSNDSTDFIVRNISFIFLTNIEEINTPLPVLDIRNEILLSTHNTRFNMLETPKIIFPSIPEITLNSLYLNYLIQNDSISKYKLVTMVENFILMPDTIQTHYDNLNKIIINLFSSRKIQKLFPKNNVIFIPSNKQKEYYVEIINIIKLISTMGINVMYMYSDNKDRKHLKELQNFKISRINFTNEVFSKEKVLLVINEFLVHVPHISNNVTILHLLTDKRVVKIHFNQLSTDMHTYRHFYKKIDMLNTIVYQKQNIYNTSCNFLQAKTIFNPNIIHNSSYADQVISILMYGNKTLLTSEIYRHHMGVLFYLTSATRRGVGTTIKIYLKILVLLMFSLLFNLKLFPQNKKDRQLSIVNKLKHYIHQL